MEKILDSVLKFLRLDGLLENVSGFIETRVQLLKIELREEVAHVVSKGLMLMAISFFGLLWLVFLSFGLAEWLNTFYPNNYAGYLWVAAGYGLLFFILIFFRKNILRAFERQMADMIKRKASS